MLLEFIIASLALVQLLQDANALAQPLPQLGLHFTSGHSIQSSELRSSLLGRLNLHFFDITPLFFGTFRRIIYVALYLQLIFDELFEGSVVPPSLVILFLAILPILDCWV